MPRQSDEAQERDTKDIARVKGRRLYALGYNYQQIATKLGWSADTIRNWAAEHGWGTYKESVDDRARNASESIDAEQKSRMMVVLEDLIMDGMARMEDTRTGKWDATAKAIATLQSQKLLLMGEATSRSESMAEDPKKVVKSFLASCDVTTLLDMLGDVQPDVLGQVFTQLPPSSQPN